MKLTKKTKIILITVHVILVAIIAYLFYNFIKYGEEYRKDISYSYSRSLGELTENLSEMETALNQSRYVATNTGISSVTAVLRESAGSAKSAISYLPFSENNSKEIENSLSVIADFSLYIDMKIASGEKLSSDDYLGFEYLAEHCAIIKSTFEDIENQILNEEINIGDTRSILSKSLMLPSLDEFDANLGEVESTISELASPTYDGIFSEHIENDVAVYLSDKEEISEEEAREKASILLAVQEDLLSLIHEDETAISSYHFSYEDSIINISKIGGEVVYYKKSKEVETANLQYDDALEKAKEYLSKLGYENMTETYFSVNDNICNINFCAVQDDVVLYTDLVKISIELGEGETVEFSSDGFIMNNQERDNLLPSLSENDAKNIVSKNLTIENSKIVIIPSSGNEEILCYEFTCSDIENEKNVHVFINAETGLEEKIYIE
ncbi:MAG: germination protein YpeB [Clostridia bacterium]